MSTWSPAGWWRRYHALPRDSTTKTLILAFVVAFVCALIVTTSAVLLQPRWEASLDTTRAQSLLATLRSLPGLEEIQPGHDAATFRIELIDLQRGEAVAGGDAEAFDARAAAADPSTSVVIPKALDHAGIGRRAKQAAVYLVGNPRRPRYVVLPVYGLGYQSVLHAFLVLEGDLRTIAAFTIYEHGETAGVGSRVADPAWLAGFGGKQVFDDDGRFALRVTTRGGGGPHHVDGLSGATRSSNAVAKLLAYWLGPQGYGPFLKKLAP